MGVKTSIREMQGLGRHQFSQFSPQQKKYLAPDTGTFFRMTRTRSVSLLQTQGAAGLCSGAKEVTGVKYTCWQLLLWVVATTNSMILDTHSHLPRKEKCLSGPLYWTHKHPYPSHSLGRSLKAARIAKRKQTRRCPLAWDVSFHAEPLVRRSRTFQRTGVN